MHQTRLYTKSIREVANALNRSHTAVYPIDAPGLQTSQAYDASSSKEAGGRTAQLNNNVDLINQNMAEHSTMDSIAEETGGHALYNTNGLAEAAQSAVADGSSYYAMTYAPKNTRADGKLRQIKVTCLKPGCTLEYRRSYFAEGAAGAKLSLKAGEATAQSNDASASDPMEVPLRHGAPPAHELFFEAHPTRRRSCASQRGRAR